MHPYTCFVIFIDEFTNIYLNEVLVVTSLNTACETYSTTGYLLDFMYTLTSYQVDNSVLFLSILQSRIFSTCFYKCLTRSYDKLLLQFIWYRNFVSYHYLHVAD